MTTNITPEVQSVLDSGKYTVLCFNRNGIYHKILSPSIPESALPTEYEIMEFSRNLSDIFPDSWCVVCLMADNKYNILYFRGGLSDLNRDNLMFATCLV